MGIPWKKDIKRLERRRDFLVARVGDRPKSQTSYDRSEIQTLNRVIKILEEERNKYEIEQDIFGEL